MKNNMIKFIFIIFLLSSCLNFSEKSDLEVSENNRLQRNEIIVGEVLYYRLINKYLISLLDFNIKN